MRVNLKVVLIACVMVGFRHLAVASGNPGVSARHSLVPTSRLTSVPIGDSTIEIKVADTGTDVTFIRVHQNEMPAGSVGTRINTEIPSRYIDLSQRAHREVTLTLTGHRYWFDPNRIYSVDAAPGTLGVGVSPAATHATMTLARVITGFLLPNAPVIALHNNKGTLLESYASGPFMKFTNGVYINPRMVSSTFAVVSTQLLFDAIKHLGISVVWEDRAGTNDDGSLLAYAQRNNIPYVNIEAAQGASLEAQLSILRQIVPILRLAQPAR